MGLDMYLTTNSRKLTKEVHRTEPYGEYITPYYRRSGTVLYWRKANAIHKWFVDNVQNGNDDCGDYEVYWEQLMELKGICKRIVEECPLIDGKVRTGDSWNGAEWVPQYEDGKVMSNVELAEEILPSQSGFFFGSTDYDQWYYDDIRWTYEQLSVIESLLTVEQTKYGYTKLGMKGEPDWDVRFYYHSSW